MIDFRIIAHVQFLRTQVHDRLVVRIKAYNLDEAKIKARDKVRKDIGDLVKVTRIVI